MRTNEIEQISDLVIPVYVVTDAASSPLVLEDVLEYVFAVLAETGGSVRLANIMTYGG